LYPLKVSNRGILVGLPNQRHRPSEVDQIIGNRSGLVSSGQQNGIPSSMVSGLVASNIELPLARDSLSTVPRCCIRRPLTSDPMAIRETRATIANPVATFQRELASGKSYSLTAMPSRRIVHPRPGGLLKRTQARLSVQPGALVLALHQ